MRMSRDEEKTLVNRAKGGDELAFEAYGCRSENACTGAL